MTIHGGSSLDEDAPYKIACCEDLAPCESVDKAWYSPGKRLLVVALGARRYETIADVEPHEIERRVHAAREADARNHDVRSLREPRRRRVRRSRRPEKHPVGEVF